MRPPVLGGAPVKEIKPQGTREARSCSEEENLAARVAAKAA